MKDKKIFCAILLAIIFILLFNVNNCKYSLIIDTLTNNTSEYSSSMFSIMIETYYNSGEYREFDSASLSSNVYFNQEYSYCTNYDSLNYNDNIVSISTNSDEYCYLYFDIAEEQSPLLNLNIVTNYNNYNSNFFSSEVYDYYFEVDSDTYSIEIRASIKGINVTIEGAGYIDITYGYNTKEITVIKDEKEYIYNITIYVPDNDDSLANYIIENSDSETLLQHTISLKNGAGDNKYRYSGLQVDNYICFGVTKCSDSYNEEYLYRIIEIDPNTGYIKVIKNSVYDKLEYDTYWNNDYGSSSLYTSLNTTFLESFDESWKNLIVTKDWDIYGATWTSIYTNLANAKDIYDSETSSTYRAKIGLMNIYDYAYSTESKYWSYPLYYYGDDDYDLPSNSSWLYQGYSEFTIARSRTFTYSIWYIQDSGNVRERYVSLETNIRPVFYISNIAKYLKGDGTLQNPYIISVSY